MCEVLKAVHSKKMSGNECVCRVLFVQPVDCWSMEMEDPTVPSAQVASY